MFSNCKIVESYNFCISISMQFLKSKMTQIKQYSKTVIGKSNKVVNSPKELLEHLLRDPSPVTQKAIYEQLASFSKNSDQNNEIADFVVMKIENFKYEAAIMKRTQKMLNVTIYLLKHGNKTLAFDIKNNLTFFQELQKLDSRHFEHKFHKKAKELDNDIQQIKHHAKFIQKLVTDDKVLQQQRLKASKLRQSQKMIQESEDVGETSVGLKMNMMANSQLGKAVEDRSQIERSGEKEEVVETTYTQLAVKKAVHGNKRSSMHS